MSLVIGSVPTPLTWHGAWLRLIEDTTTAHGALASALATRMAAWPLKTLLFKNLKYFNREFECSFDPKPKVFQCIFNEFSIIATCSMLPRPTLMLWARGALLG